MLEDRAWVGCPLATARSRRSHMWRPCRPSLPTVIQTASYDPVPSLAPPVQRDIHLLLDQHGPIAPVHFDHQSTIDVRLAWTTPIVSTSSLIASLHRTSYRYPSSCGVACVYDRANCVSGSCQDSEIGTVDVETRGAVEGDSGDWARMWQDTWRVCCSRKGLTVRTVIVICSSGGLTVWALTS